MILKAEEGKEPSLGFLKDLNGCFARKSHERS